MGRPIAYTAKEITTAITRAEYLLRISDDALAVTPGQEEVGYKRYIKKEPVGVVLVIFAWIVWSWLFISSLLHVSVCFLKVFSTSNLPKLPLCFVESFVCVLHFVKYQELLFAWLRKEEKTADLVVSQWTWSSPEPWRPALIFSFPCVSVSISHSCQFSHPGSACWQFRHPQALAPNAHHR
jgi:hypothetical protein